MKGDSYLVREREHMKMDEHQEGRGYLTLW